MGEDFVAFAGLGVTGRPHSVARSCRLASNRRGRYGIALLGGQRVVRFAQAVDHGGSGDNAGGAAGGDEGNGDEDPDGDDSEDKMRRNPLGALVDRLFTLLGSVLGGITQVPTQIIVAMTAVATTLLNNFFQGRSRFRDRLLQQEDKRLNELEEKRIRMYESYREYSEPLLKAAAKLQDHLYIIGSRKARGKEVLDDPKYSAYLLGRFFCYVEVFKQLSPSMTFGKPRRDRIFSNILGRIQVVLAMDESELVQLYGGDKRSSSIENPFKIPAQGQASLGQLMMRERWLEYKFKGGSPHKTSTYAHSGLHFPEFVQLFEENSEFSRWFGPLVESLHPDLANSTSGNQNLRLGLFQTALVDLVDFLDPAPMCTIIPAYRRRRLYTPPRMVYTKMPQTLANIYSEEADQRDGKLPEVRGAPNTVDVFVSGPTGVGSTFHTQVSNVIGDCPYSHRVLLALEEKEVSYNLITIDRKLRPSWYYNVHPEAKVPVISHDGILIEESSNIVDYLEEKFPEKVLAQRNQSVATDPFPVIENFRSKFTKYIEHEHEKQEFIESLVSLDSILQTFITTERGPFFGGKKLSEEDVVVMPYLYHMEIAGKMVRDFELPYGLFPRIKKYMDAMKVHPTFQKTKATPDNLLFGYVELHAGMHHDELSSVSDILE
ncbi:hypothetical protein NDN08_007555 [Rhodosorus marinus]|uniref:glutathione dehydrogenase (ascorbate) n=1 Tax=Rhodosorus marinus TaxID=101924 RepID=A0AAV8UXW2_9RHOD|nr:hypothetical protein NDN08_007555 [Rhodosorus marinus]